jgi:hypothetical protein
MAQAKRRSPTQQPLGFDYDEGHAERGLTALAGIPLLLQAFHSLDLPRSVGRHVSVKQRQCGLDQASYVESFLIFKRRGRRMPHVQARPRPADRSRPVDAVLEAAKIRPQKIRQSRGIE